MKNILVISYSQSGQLTEIVEKFSKPLQGNIDFVNYTSKKSFSFPWRSHEFFNTMPETVLEVDYEVEDIHYNCEKYDLIVLGYQPWFLSPSLPTTALLKNEKFKSLLKDTPVVTVIGSRNMWLNSQESVKKLIQDAGGKLVGNVPFIDKTNNLLSAVTILHWMLTGKKEKKWGVFPLPGVNQEDIDQAGKFGQLLNEDLTNNTLENFQKRILLTGEVNINTSILFIEGRAKKLFLIWANAIVKKGTTEAKRRRWVKFFTYYLFIALFMVAPIVLTFYSILIRPFSSKGIKEKKTYFCGVELKK